MSMAGALPRSPGNSDSNTWAGWGHLFALCFARLLELRPGSRVWTCVWHTGLAEVQGSANPRPPSAPPPLAAPPLLPGVPPGWHPGPDRPASPCTAVGSHLLVRRGSGQSVHDKHPAMPSPGFVFHCPASHRTGPPSSQSHCRAGTQPAVSRGSLPPGQWVPSLLPASQPAEGVKRPRCLLALQEFVGHWGTEVGPQGTGQPAWLDVNPELPASVLK